MNKEQEIKLQHLVENVVKECLAEHLITENVSDEVKLFSPYIIEQIKKEKRYNGSFIVNPSDLPYEIKKRIDFKEKFCFFSNLKINYQFHNYNSKDEIEWYLPSSIISEENAEIINGAENNINIIFNFGLVNQKFVVTGFQKIVYHEIDHLFNYIALKRDKEKIEASNNWNNKFIPRSNDRRFADYDDILHYIFYYSNHWEQTAFASGHYASLRYNEKNREVYKIIDFLTKTKNDIPSWDKPGLFDFIRNKYDWIQLGDEEIKKVLVGYCNKAIKRFKQKINQTYK